jgi:Ca2+-transporting ATPase
MSNIRIHIEKRVRMEYYHNMSSDEVVKHFTSSEKAGLAKEEADSRLAKFGKNRLVAHKKVTLFQHFIAQFMELMVLVLMGAGFIAFLLGKTIDACIILFVIVLNAIIGVIQEYKAEKAIEALKKMMNPHATVIRDGEEKVIPAEELVPGDIIILEEGTRIPADARILEAVMLKVDEAVLTGESIPVGKNDVALGSGSTGIGDQTNMLFMGTTITNGRCKAIVTATGMSTEFGKIAGLTSQIKEEKSPLQKQLAKVGKFIAIAVLVICAVVFALGLLSGKPLFEMLLLAVSLGVAAVPEGLPAIMTISLAFGVQRMAKRKAIIRKLSSVETLGSATVICTDKTGTLTKNEMTVKKMWVNKKFIHVEGEGYGPQGRFLHGSQVYSDDTLIKVLRAGLLCNNAVLEKDAGSDAWNIVGDPTEGALVVSAQKAGLRQKHEEESCKRVFEVPFSSETKRMITIHNDKGGKGIVAYMKGATAVVLDKCSHIEIDGRIKKLETKEKEEIKVISRDMSEQALRVLAFAYKKFDNAKEADRFKLKGLKEEGFIFIGLQGMIDPPRPEVKEAVAKCKKAGIRIFIITGDHGLTAKAIAKEIGLATDDTRIIKGTELDKMNEEELTLALKEEVIFARVSAEHKMRVVSNLMGQGEIVAVTGDGVNDAPALKKANIGVAMGITGTDVSKEASKMILADDNFASLVNAVEEGRGIFENIRIFLKYLFIGNGAGILIVFLALLIGLPLPILALQILWFNLLTETLPSIALTKEPAEKDLMEKKPRHPKEIFFTKKDSLEMGANALIITAGVLGIFYYILSANGWRFGTEAGFTFMPDYYLYATTMAFTTMVLFQLFNIFNTKSPNSSIFFEELFNNKWLLLATAMSIILQVLVLNVPFLSHTFMTTPLSLIDWAIATAVASSIIWINEIYKLFSLRKQAQG